jgi:OOP family OmpA-OmpF porin
VADDPLQTGLDASEERSDPLRSAEFAELRRLLLSYEQHELEELRQRIEAMGLTPEELAEHLPEAVALRTGSDEKLARALAPTLEGAFTESVHRNPDQIATAIYPILGPAIRKAIADTMAGLVNTINRAFEHSLSWQGIKWRLEAWRTGVSYAQVVIKHGLVYRVEEVYLIHAQTGLLLASVTVEDLEAQDPDVISGMLTAIRDFVRDSWHSRSSQGLRHFMVDESTVLVEPGPYAQLAAKVRGQPPDHLLSQMQATLETIHLQFSKALQRYDGDASPFETAKPLMEDLLETVVTTDQSQTRSVAPRIAWAVLGILVVLLGVLWIRSNRRWNTAVATLDREPGIVLLEADRSFRRWRFSGLRDPVAADPMTLLSTLGVDSSRITADWEPYLSFDPDLVVERGRQLLGAPVSVTFSLTGDTLEGRGTAPASWVGRTSVSAPSVPGVVHLDLTNVNPEFPTEITRLRMLVEGERIRFAVGSAALPPGTRTQLRRLADAVVELRTWAGDLSYRAELELVGRTDSTGSNETNQVLSQVRADAVARALVTLGVTGEVVHPTGIGTADPVSADSPEAAARENRSVSFAVRLTRAGSGEGERQ